MKRQLQRCTTIVSLRRIRVLRELSENGETRIGAMTSLSAVERSHRLGQRFPALVAAVAGISSPVLRQMGTLGGNLCIDTRCTYYNQSEEWRRSIDYCMKEVGDVCWVAPGSKRCWAVSSSDSAPILCALGAHARLVSGAGERTVPVAALFHDDGISYLEKRPDEILAEVIIPDSSSTPFCRSSSRKLRRRGSIDFSVLSVAAAIWNDASERIERAAIYLGAVASAPLRVPAAESALIGQRLDEESISAAARHCRAAATPLDNTDFAPQWRNQMVEVFAARALSDCRR
jgi:4-hydroxybenzoyl-CoA reductase subunit beta